MSDHVKSTAALGENVSQVSSASNTNSNIVAKCIFCKIVRREADATTVFEVTYKWALMTWFQTPLSFQNDQFLAFRDIYPASDKHYLVIPKNHICGVNDLTADDIPLGKSPVFDYVNSYISNWLVEQMKDIALQVMQQDGYSTEQIRWAIFFWQFI